MELTREQIIEILESAKLPNLPKLEGDFYNEFTNFYTDKDVNFIKLNIEGGTYYEVVMIIGGDDIENTIVRCAEQELISRYNNVCDDPYFFEYIDFEQMAIDNIDCYGKGNLLSFYDGLEYRGKDSEGNEYAIFIRG